LLTMNFRKAESPATAAYAANSRLDAASADRRISVMPLGDRLGCTPKAICL